jgi:hypothetical protein
MNATDWNTMMSSPSLSRVLQTSDWCARGLRRVGLLGLYFCMASRAVAAQEEILDRANTVSPQIVLDSQVEKSLDDALGQLDRRRVDPIPPSSLSGERRMFVEGAVTIPHYRDNLVVPLPSPSIQPAWRARSSFDVHQNLELGSEWSLMFSNRLNLQRSDGGGQSEKQLIRNDLREFYFSHQGKRQLWDLGRLNARAGVASGYNPTDYFKTRAVVERVSQDPSVLRENRLGTFMLRGQYLLDEGALAVMWAPRLADSPAVDLVGETGWNPQWGRTNSATRIALRGNYRLAPDFDPEVSAIVESGRWKLGVNLTRALSESVTGYLEWTGGRNRSMLARAYGAGIAEGRFPQGFRPVLPYDEKQRFLNDLALGFSWTANSRTYVTVEYDYHQGGFSKSEWQRWFNAGATGASGVRQTQATLGQLNYLRSWALDQQEPLSRHSLFTRVEWRNAIANNVTLAYLNVMNLSDRSLLQQMGLRWDGSKQWSISCLFNVNYGRVRSEYGSSTVDKSLLLNAVLYF